ncbi:hypothetical protein CASFOL_032244 [Castilleja foliolosa]|uniref:Senescence regulator S40 n=1 Tax=Castilleja foliolosa TaxID=1961234 RepID=A0ABD3C0X3_9LAMI
MDQINATGYRHRRSPSSDRFIGVFSPPSTVATISSSPTAGDELNEVDVFYTANFSDAPPASPSPAAVNSRYRHSFLKSEKYGILAALPEDSRSADPTASFGRDIPSIPKPQPSSEMNKCSQSMPIRRFQQSAPVKIPMVARKQRNSLVGEVEVSDEEEEVLPPHEMVARGSMRDRTTTFSVLEGVGRTLKGRDLRQVRNAVWRQTGFLD